MVDVLTYLRIYVFIPAGERKVVQVVVEENHDQRQIGVQVL